MSPIYGGCRLRMLIEQRCCLGPCSCNLVEWCSLIVMTLMLSINPCESSLNRKDSRTLSHTTPPTIYSFGACFQMKVYMWRIYVFFTNKKIRAFKYITLFISMAVFCGTNDIPWNIPGILPTSRLNVGNIREYLQSHILTLSWIWITLCNLVNSM